MGEARSCPAHKPRDGKSHLRVWETERGSCIIDPTDVGERQEFRIEPSFQPNEKEQFSGAKFWERENTSFV